MKITDTHGSRDNESIESEIKRFLLENPDTHLPMQNLNSDQSLLAIGLIDSLAVLDIIAFLEARFDIQFEPEDLPLDRLSIAIP